MSPLKGGHGYRRHTPIPLQIGPHDYTDITGLTTSPDKAARTRLDPGQTRGWKTVNPAKPGQRQPGLLFGRRLTSQLQICLGSGGILAVNTEGQPQHFANDFHTGFD